MQTSNLLRKVLKNVPDLSDESLYPIVKWIDDMTTLNDLVTESNKLMFGEGSYKFAVLSSILTANTKSNEATMKLSQFINKLEKIDTKDIYKLNRER